MKQITKTIITLAATVSMVAIASQEVVIRPAQEKDLAAMNQLCYQEHYNGSFKPALAGALGKYMMIGSMTEDFVNKQVDYFIEIQKKKNEQCMQQQNPNPQNDYLLVAYAKESDGSEKLAAYCRFNKENAKQILMSYFVVDQNMRKKGIGKQLAQTAFEIFSGITACRFQWLAEDATMNAFFEKHCIEVNNVHMDYLSGHILEYLPTEELKDKITLPILLKEFILSRKNLK